jgi:hypothetical protein
MSTGLTFALISAAVALLSILLSAYATQSNSKLQARLNEELERRQEQASSQSRLEQLLSRYRDPLLAAAVELQSRIYNLVLGDFLDLLRKGDQDEQNYAVGSTLFVIAQYLGWVEALRRGVQYLDLGDVEDSREFIRRLEAVRHSFATRHVIEDAPFRIYRAEQRAIGELMLKAHLDKRSGSMLWRTRGYASFCARLKGDPLFAAWFARLDHDVSVLPTTMDAARERLVALQNALIDLIDFLDNPPLRVPPELRSKITQISVSARQQSAAGLKAEPTD